MPGKSRVCLINETYAKVPDDLWPLVGRYLELQNLEKERWARYHKELGLACIAGGAILLMATFVGKIWLGSGGFLMRVSGMKDRRERDLEPFAIEKQKIEKRFESRDLWLAPDAVGKLFVYPRNFRP